MELALFMRDDDRVRVVSGVMMLVQAFYGHDRVWSIAIFTLALTINGAVTAGYLGNGLDIAPKFSGNMCLFFLMS